MRYVNLAVPLLIAILATTGFSPATERSDPTESPYTRLGPDAELLQAAFNRDRGKVRLVLGVSPTCGACLRRARAAQQSLLDRFDSDDLVAHVVWLPTHGAREGDVEQVIGLVPDARATHYWDPHGAFMPIFEEPLASGSGDAEGVVMLYDRDAAWDRAGPPTPAAWIYQPRNIDRLAARLPALLGR